MTSSPPAPYNFAVLPEIRDIDAFHDLKERGVAYLKPSRYVDITMPRNTGAGALLGGLAFLLGFAIVWHIWWMALLALFGVGVVVTARAFNEDTQYRFSASEVARIEDRRHRALAGAVGKPAQARDGLSPGSEPMPGGVT